MSDPAHTTVAPPTRRIILRTVVGSRGHGTETAESDWDFREVFLEPTRVIVSMEHYDKYVQNPGKDSNGRELLHFLRMMVQNNPTTIEILAAPPLEVTSEGEELRALLPCFYTRYGIKSTFLGFSNNQQRLIKKCPSDGKAMCHYLRVLYNGLELLQKGSMTVRIVDTPIGAKVRAAKLGQMQDSEALEMGQDLERQILAAYEVSKLPDVANLAPVEDFLQRVRRNNW